MWYNKAESGERMSTRMRQTLYITDALAVGYTVIHRQPFILIFSIGLSVYLWLGSAITLAMPFSYNQSIAAQWIGTLHAVDARTLLVVTNSIPVLAPGLDAVVPPPLALPVMEFAGVVMILNVITLALSSWFLVSLRQIILRERLPWQTMLRRTLNVALRLIIVFVLIGCVIAPIGGLSLLTMLLIPATTTLIYYGWIVLVIAGLIGFGFTPEIITLGDEHSLQALYKSWQFARQRWLAIATFLAICTVIEVGFAQLWRSLATQPGWLAPAIIGNAYIGSGIRAARLQFYRYHAATLSPA